MFDFLANTNNLYRAVKNIALFIIINNVILSMVIPNVDNKCIWVKGESLTDSISVISMFTFVQRNDINKIFFQVREDGYALYESQLVPKYEKLDSLFDPLNYILTITKNTNIEVHGWFNTFLLWSLSKQPNSENHIYFICPECLATDVNGKKDSDINLNQNHSLNWEGIYLSPINPEVKKYLLLVIDELLKTYDLDGIHLDYLRYQDLFYGYNKIGIENFEKKYSYNPKDINRGIISTRFHYSENEVDSLIKLWDDYRINSITEFIRSVKYLMINDGYNIELSVAVKPNIYEAKTRWYQDWISWIRENLIDYAIVMNYETDINKFNLNNKYLINELSNKEIKKIVLGLSSFNQNSYDISDKILLSRLNGFVNFSINNYNVKQDTLNWYNPIFNVLNFNLK